MRVPQTAIHQMLPHPTVNAEDLGERKKQSEQGNRIGPQKAEVHMKGMNSVSSEAFIFPYTEC